MLKKDIREFINRSRCETLGEVINWAREREAELNRQVVTGKKRKVEFSNPPSKKTKSGVLFKKFEPRSGTRQCKMCGRNHPGECRLKQDFCFRCGKVGHTTPQCPSPINVCYNCNLPGHVKSQCPLLQGNTGKWANPQPTQSIGGEKKGETSRARGRAFQITAEEAKVIPDVVTGTFLINNIPVHILFDSRASYSFVSTNFSRSFTFPSIKLENPLEIEIADSKNLLYIHEMRWIMLNIFVKYWKF
ncbi:putative transcription factor interactor and regulator CCHC(Zn) family [Helianthus annuus]|nr:putative transcription factor interactor and regulator CCHC(Zn) family [Helianthus annuus]